MDESVDIQFLINSPEVEQETDRVRSSIAGVEKTVDATAKAISKAFSEEILNSDRIEEKINNQKAALKGLEASYDALKKKVEAMAPGLAKETAKQELAGAKQEIDAEREALEQLTQVQEQNTQSRTSLRTQIRQQKDAMADMVEGTEEYAAAMQRLGELQDRFGDISAQGNVYADDEKEFRATTEAIEGVSGAMSAAVGVASLLGMSEENLVKIQTRLQAVMAISVGVQQVAQVLNKDSYFSQVLLVKVKNLLTAATTRFAAALGISNVQAQILMGTLTLGLSVAIGAVIVMLSKWQAEREKQKQLDEEAAQAQQQYYKSVADNVAKSLVEYRKLQAMWNALNGDSVKQRKFLKDHADGFKNLGTKVTGVRDAENLLVANETKFIQSLMSRARAAAAMELAAEKYKAAIEKQVEWEFGAYTQEDRRQANRELLDKRKQQGGTGIPVDQWGTWIAERAKEIYDERMRGVVDAATVEADKYITKSLQENKTAEELLAEAGIKVPDGDGKDTSGDDPQKKYRESILNNMRELEKSRITILHDGKKKELAELDARHRETLARIERDRKELEAAAKAAGRNGLTDSEAAGFDERTQNVVWADALAREDVEKKYSQSLEDIYRDLGDVFLTEEERKRAAVKKTYDDFRRQAADALAGGDITPDQHADLTIRINESETRAMLADSLEQFKTYGDRAKEIVESYNAQISQLRAAGYDEQAAEAELQKQEALDALNMEVANKEAAFTAWLERAQKMGLEQLKQKLQLAQTSLQASAKLTDKEKAILLAQIKTLQDRIAALGAADAAETSGEKSQKRWKNTLSVMNEVGETVNNIVNSFDGLDENTKAALSSATNVAGGIIAMITGIKALAVSGAEAIKGVERASVILAVIGAAVQILTAIFSMGAQAEKQHQEALQKVANSRLAAQREYNKLLLEQNLLLKEAESVFGVDYIDKASNSIVVYKQAISDLKEAMKGETPTMNVWERLTGDVAGTYAKRLAAYNQGLGAVNDIAIKTGHEKTGLFGWGKGRDLYTGVLDLYPDLVTGEGRLNVERAKAILNTHEMSDANKELLQDLVDLEEQAAEAQEALRGYLNETFGSLGDSILSSIENAIRNGTDAWQEFGKEGAAVLEKLGNQIAYSLFFSDKFKKLQAELEKTYGSGKSQQEIANEARDLIGGFYQGIGDDMANAQQYLEQWKESARQYGLDLYASDSGGSSPSGTSGQLQAQITEGTASQLVGLWNITAMEIRQVRELTTGQLAVFVEVRDDVCALLAQVILIEKNTRETADNTAETVRKLEEGFKGMTDKLADIEKNTKPNNSRL